MVEKKSICCVRHVCVEMQSQTKNGCFTNLKRWQRKIKKEIRPASDILSVHSLFGYQFSAILYQWRLIVGESVVRLFQKKYRISATD